MNDVDCRLTPNYFPCGRRHHEYLKSKEKNESTVSKGVIDRTWHEDWE